MCTQRRFHGKCNGGCRTYYKYFADPAIITCTKYKQKEGGPMLVRSCPDFKRLKSITIDFKCYECLEYDRSSSHIFVFPISNSVARMAPNTNNLDGGSMSEYMINVARLATAEYRKAKNEQDEGSEGSESSESSERSGRSRRG